MPTGALDLPSDSAQPREGCGGGVVAVCCPALPGLREEGIAACAALNGVERALAASPAVVGGPGLSTEIERALAMGAEQVLIATGPFEAPADLLDRARAWMQADPRLAVICFLANQAGALSLDVDDTTGVAAINDRLRAIGNDRRPVPIAAAEGCLFLVGRSALMASDGFDRRFDSDPYHAVCEFALRASRRGFHTMVDGQAYVRRPAEAYARSLENDQALRGRLNEDYPFFPALYDLQAADVVAPLGEALALARAAARGLRLAIDVSAIACSDGVEERIATLIKAMSDEPNVSWLGLISDHLLRDPVGIGLHPKIEILPGDVEALKRRDIDVLHVPSTIASSHPWWTWRTVARRTVITLDHPPEAAARTSLAADLILVHSAGMITQLRRARAPFPLERVTVVPPAATTQAPVRIPASVSERGWAAERFSLCLTPAMDSQSIRAALAIVQACDDSISGLRLVVIDEDALLPERRLEVSSGLRRADSVLLLAPELSNGERAWLLEHAEFVLVHPSLAGAPLLSCVRAPVFVLEPGLGPSCVLDAIADPARRQIGAMVKDGRSRDETILVRSPSMYHVYLDALARPPRRI